MLPTAHLGPSPPGPMRGPGPQGGGNGVPTLRAAAAATRRAKFCPCHHRCSATLLPRLVLPPHGVCGVVAPGMSALFPLRPSTPVVAWPFLMLTQPSLPPPHPPPPPFHHPPSQADPFRHVLLNLKWHWLCAARISCLLGPDATENPSAEGQQREARAPHFSFFFSGEA